MFLQRIKRLHPIWRAAYMLGFSLLLNGCLFGVLSLVLLKNLNQVWAILLLFPCAAFVGAGLSTFRYIARNAYIVEDTDKNI
ncbi:hypothetical protein KDA_40300 [Dictyobacter alpinus]|uniref:Uncharacterized protein n=1 Tax=Dictyobacter alpinus TaxID=2014873 RepID=A0A402BB64_9CHLR|nr:hypothetical protein KDA_40300 [Dictyobacter alpinus]